MIKDPKYIVAEDYPVTSFISNSIIFVFPAQINHKAFASKIGCKIIGAGFVDLKNKTCYGKSTSLDIKSREEDTYLLRSQY